MSWAQEAALSGARYPGQDPVRDWQEAVDRTIAAHELQRETEERRLRGEPLPSLKAQLGATAFLFGMAIVLGLVVVGCTAGLRVLGIDLSDWDSSELAGLGLVLGIALSAVGICVVAVASRRERNRRHRRSHSEPESE